MGDPTSLRFSVRAYHPGGVGDPDSPSENHLLSGPSLLELIAKLDFPPKTSTFNDGPNHEYLPG